ncbi:MAG: VanW family protein [Deltaproteobacteria bacterium]|nr:VanW family protein [Deltaproteobacteria bacterium]
MKLPPLPVLSVLFASVGAASGYLLLPERSVEAATRPSIRVLGQELHPGRDALTTARAVARQFLRQHVRVTSRVLVTVQEGDALRTREEERVVERSREDFGARVDETMLAHLISSATDPTSPLLRHHAAIAAGRPIELPVPVQLNGAVALPLLMQLKEEVDHAPVDARLDVESRSVVAEQPGRHMDVYATLARLDDALGRGTASIEAVVSTSPARVTRAQLANVEMREVLGWFDTSYNADESKRDRTYNLHLAASKINGYVWMPGEVFDFNAVVGDRSEANGFRMATVISAGELIDGVGGGTCQIAGTLHAASFFAGLEILDRRPHTRPSGYIKMGLDATVVYPSINLRMRNNLPHPVVIHTRLGGGNARIELLGPARTRAVTFVRKIMHVERFPTRDIPDANLAPGQRVITQRGIPGFRVRRYRIVRDGDQAVRERWEDTYPPTVEIVHVGTGGGSGGTPNPDDHPEYTADQYMATVQSPGETRMQEVRRPGMTGVAGWMVAQGFSRGNASAPAPAAPSPRPAPRRR